MKPLRCLLRAYRSRMPRENPPAAEYNYNKNRARWQVNECENSVQRACPRRRAPLHAAIVCRNGRKNLCAGEKTEHFFAPARTYGIQAYAGPQNAGGCAAPRKTEKKYIPSAAESGGKINERYRELRRQRLPVDPHSPARALLLAERHTERHSRQLLPARHPRRPLLYVQKGRICKPFFLFGGVGRFWPPPPLPGPARPFPAAEKGGAEKTPPPPSLFSPPGRARKGRAGFRSIRLLFRRKASSAGAR